MIAARALMVLLLALAATAARAANVPFWAGPAVSGSWYDPARDGEGFVVEFLPDGTALAVWFTYPAVGEDGAQAWIIAQGGVVDGGTIRFAQVLKPRGGVFGEAFDPARIELAIWGTLEIEFADCTHATARYAGPLAYGSGSRALTRLTTHDQLDCNGARALTASGARALSGLRSKSGAWYVATRSGEGWLVEDLGNGQSVVYWFTYDPAGEQAWTIGVGTRDGGRIAIDGNVITSGTRFGAAFDAAAVHRDAWGTLTFDFGDCDHVTVAYASSRAGYGSGAREAQRLTALAGAPCIDGAPAARTQGAWVQEAGMPAPPQSELDVALLDGKVYAIGGFGDARGFKRYDPATQLWERLPDLPAGRDHLAAFALDGAVYYCGGNNNWSGDQGTAGFRYDPAANRWSAVPELPYVVASRAAVLNGRAYIGNEDGTLFEYDARQRRLREIAKADATARDHSQVVAFLGEIWMIAGRFPNTTRVAIYDPVSERWRAGPPIAHARGGFAAAVDGAQIVVAGGEFIGGMSGRLEPSTEVYVAGAESWHDAQQLAEPVHGTAAVVVDGRFLIVSGSTIPTSTGGATGRLYSIRMQP